MHGTRFLGNFPLCTVLFGICTSRGTCASARASVNFFSNSQFFWNILENMHVVLVVALLRYQNWHLPSAQWTILKSSKNSSICKTLKIQDARLLRICTACVQIRISQVHGYIGGKSMQLQLYLCWVKKWRDQNYHHFIKCQLSKNARLFDLSRTGSRYRK